MALLLSKIIPGTMFDWIPTFVGCGSVFPRQTYNQYNFTEVQVLRVIIILLLQNCQYTYHQVISLHLQLWLITHTLTVYFVNETRGNTQISLTDDTQLQMFTYI